MANTETAVTVIEPTAALQVNLDQYPEERFNRLIPTQTIGLGTDLIKPIVQVVTVDVEDTYGNQDSRDIPPGRRALKKRALDALASTAGVDFTEERRLDDGSEPLVCGVQVRAEMLLPTGRRLTTTGTKWVDMRRMSWKDGLQSAQAGKFKATIYEHTSSRARNRAIRALLSLRQSYAEADLRKPFAVLSFVPNMDHPDIRSRILDAMAPAIAATYGPAAARISAGEDVVEVAEIDDADDTIEGTATEVRSVTPPAADETASETGGGDVPDWAKPAEAPTAKAKGTSAKPASIPERLASSAAASGLAGALRDEAHAKLREDVGKLIGAASPLDWSIDVLPVLQAAYGPDFRPAEITAAQARSIAILADSFDSTDDFEAAWREAAQAARKAAAA